MIYLHIITNYVTAEILIFNILVAQITIFLYRNSTDVSTEAQCLSSLAWSPSDNDDALSMLRWTLALHIYLWYVLFYLPSYDCLDKAPSFRAPFQKTVVLQGVFRNIDLIETCTLWVITLMKH